jgi:hypothetical protein
MLEVFFLLLHHVTVVCLIMNGESSRMGEERNWLRVIRCIAISDGV